MKAGGIVRTLPAEMAAGYLRRNASFRMFVELPDAGLFLGTEGATIDGNLYGNRINPAGTIVWDAPLFGGMGSISNVSFSNLELDRDLSFSTFADLEAYDQNSVNGAGMITSTGPTYENVRGAPNGIFHQTNMLVGRRRETLITNFYTNYRAFLQFEPSSILETCEGAAIHLDGIADHSGAGVELVVVEGTWPALATVSMYKSFAGWYPG